MKRPFYILAIVTFLGCSQREDSTTNESPAGAQPAKKPKPKPDFIMDSPTAVSNAMAFQAPPKDWNIYCDDQGHYAPAYKDFVVLLGGVTVRTSRFEAIVAAWRNKEIWDTPREPEPHSTNKWALCPAN